MPFSTCPFLGKPPQQVGGARKYDDALNGYYKGISDEHKAYLTQLFYKKLKASVGQRALYETMMADVHKPTPHPSWREVRAYENRSGWLGYDWFRHAELTAQGPRQAADRPHGPRLAQVGRRARADAVAVAPACLSTYSLCVPDPPVANRTPLSSYLRFIQMRTVITATVATELT